MVEDTTPREFALANSLRVYNMWFPLNLISLTRTKVWKPVSIPHSMPMALYNHDTQHIEYNRTAILRQLRHVTFTERSTLIGLDSIPASCTLFARWVKPPVRHLPRASLLLYRALSEEAAMNEGCILPSTDINSNNKSNKTAKSETYLERQQNAHNTQLAEKSSSITTLSSAASLESSSSSSSVSPSFSSKSGSTVMDVNSLAEMLRAGQSNQDKRQRSDDDLRSRFAHALQQHYNNQTASSSSTSETLSQSLIATNINNVLNKIIKNDKLVVRTAGKVLEKTSARMRNCLRRAPLHFVLSKDELTSSVVSLAHVLWSRPDPRILYRVFTANTPTEKKEDNKERYMQPSHGHASSSRQVLFCFIEDVIIEQTPFTNKKLIRIRKIEKDGECDDDEEEEEDEEEEVEISQENTKGHENDVNDDINTVNDTLEIMRYRIHSRASALIRVLLHYISCGFRIVLLDHFPSLHHGNRVNCKRHLAPLVHYCHSCNTHGCTCTVILSIISYITAQQRGGLNSSFTLPQAGLLQFFVQHFNASLQPDPALSFVVGTSTRQNVFCTNIHRDFAAHAGLRYVDVDELLKTGK